MAKPEFVYVTYIATTPEKLWAALTGTWYREESFQVTREWLVWARGI